jgi:hypothetical protein
VNGRLIKREDRCLLRKSERDRDQLSLTRTQRAHITRRKMRRADALQCRRRTFAIVCGWSARSTPVRETAECHELISACCEWEREICANHSN